MNDNLIPNSDSTIELIIAQERLRQARQSFNLALMTTTTCILISFAGVGLVLLGKANEGTITATGGLASTGYCLKLWHSPPYKCGDSLFIDSTCFDRISPIKVEVGSPKAFGSEIQVPTWPAVLKANFRILMAAFQSRSKTHPHRQTWVLVDRDFLTVVPQLEHCWEV